MNLKDHIFNTGSKCFIIAEVAQAHDGSLGQAHAFIKAAAETGVDAIKFQTHIAEAESTLQEPFRVKFSFQDANRFDYWKRTSFKPSEWIGLKEAAENLGLVFLSSPFSIEAVDLLDSMGIEGWKVGSGEISNKPLIDRIIKTQKPILISSGMSDWKELDLVTSWLKKENSAFAIFQTTTMYPTPAEFLGLNLISELKDRYQVPVGLSDHSSKIYSGLAAYTLGARFLEVHITFSRKMFGPDALSSLEFSEVKQLVDGIRFLEIANAHPIQKDKMAQILGETKKMFEKSCVSKAALSEGHIISVDDLSFKKPGIGVPSRMVDQLIGQVLKKNVQQDHFFVWSDFEESNVRS